MHLSPLLLAIGDRIAGTAPLEPMTIVDIGPGPDRDLARLVVRDTAGRDAALDVPWESTLALHDPVAAVAAYVARTSRRSLASQLALTTGAAHERPALVPAAV